MVKLHGDFASLGMHHIGKLAQAGNELVIPDADASRGGGTQRVHLRDLRDDEPCAALGPAPDIGQVCFADGVVGITESRSHGGHHQTIRNFQGTDFDGRQQMLKGFHKRSPLQK